MRGDNDGVGIIVQIVAIIVLCIILSITFNSCTSSTWNEGICPDCNVRYELRGTTSMTKTYVCPVCGKEVKRM